MSLAVPATPYPFVHASAKRRKNTWYTIASGNWTDPNIWMCNAMTPSANLLNQYPGQASSTFVFPRVGDDVSIGLGHTVTFDTANNVITTLNNFYVSGSFLLSSSFSGRSINVMGDLQANGAVDLTSTQALSINLHGVNNYINNFTCGANSTIAYTRNGDQPVMPLTYRHLQIANPAGFSGLSGVPYLAGTKYITANLNVLGNLNIGNYQGNTQFFVNLELGNYDLFVGGTTTVTISAQVMTVGNGAGLLKSGSGNVTFVGLATFFGAMIFTGNPIVEFRGGLTVNNNNAANAFNTGTNQFNFTTASQTATLTNGTYQFTCLVSVVGAIDLTVGASSGVMSLNQPIDTATGRQVINKGNVYFNSIASLSSFTAGTFDRTSFSNTVGYTMNSAISLPYTTYNSLLIGGTGAKTPTATLSLPGSLTVNSGAEFQSSIFDLTVGTTTTNSGTLSKSSSGNIIFVGLVSLVTNSVMNLTGNPNVELRGSLTISSSASFNGAVTLTFTTNNQNITNTSGLVAIPYNVLISGAITLTNNSSLTGSIAITGTLNGNNAASTFDNRNTGTGSFQYQNAQQPMLTGVLQTNAAANTFIYNGNNSQNITGGTYRTMQIGGTATPNNKTLQGNIVVVTAYSVTGNAVLVLNSFTKT